MEIIKNIDKRIVKPTGSITIYEYDTNEDSISGAIAIINGRYPEKGYVTNEIIKELVYIVDGSGKLITPNKVTDFSKGDILFLDCKEIYAWEGNTTIFMATTPKFDPDQHKEIDE